MSSTEETVNSAQPASSTKEAVFARINGATNFYEILGIGENATPAEITKAFKACALATHPDKNNNSEESTALFTKASEAFQTLSDETQRTAYNNKLKKEQNAANQSALALSSNSQPPPPPSPTPADTGDSNNADKKNDSPERKIGSAMASIFGRSEAQKNKEKDDPMTQLVFELLDMLIDRQKENAAMRDALLQKGVQFIKGLKDKFGNTNANEPVLPQPDAGQQPDSPVPPQKDTPQVLEMSSFGETQTEHNAHMLLADIKDDNTPSLDESNPDNIEDLPKPT